MYIYVYGLDPCRYISAPGLSWDAMIKHTEVKIELIYDIDMYLFIKKGIGGGISMISKRFARANNKFCSDFKASELKKWITYLDANNLYGHSMMQKLPMKDFKIIFIT